MEWSRPDRGLLVGRRPVAGIVSFGDHVLRAAFQHPPRVKGRVLSSGSSSTRPCRSTGSCRLAIHVVTSQRVVPARTKSDAAATRKRRGDEIVVEVRDRHGGRGRQVADPDRVHDVIETRREHGGHSKLLDSRRMSGYTTSGGREVPRRLGGFIREHVREAARRWKGASLTPAGLCHRRARPGGARARFQLVARTLPGSVHHPENAPAPRDPFQVVLTRILEPETAPGN